MTTRRLRPPGAWRGRTGLFGRFRFEFPLNQPFSVPTSVEASQILIDADWCSQRAGESAVRCSTLEALEPPAGVDASPRCRARPESARCPGRRSGSALPEAPCDHTRHKVRIGAGLTRPKVISRFRMRSPRPRRALPAPPEPPAAPASGSSSFRDRLRLPADSAPTSASSPATSSAGASSSVADAADHLRSLELLARGLALGELAVCGDPAEARAGDRGVGAALAVRRGSRCSGRRTPRPSRRPRSAASASAWANLGVGLDVDLPPGQARGQTGVQALLADRQRELVLGDDRPSPLSSRRRRAPRARARARAPSR